LLRAPPATPALYPPPLPDALPISRDYACHALNLGRFGTSHEGEFDPVDASRIRPHHLLDLPLVCATGQGTTTFAIAEADLSRYRSEEHTSELQSRENLVCRLLLEK